MKDTNTSRNTCNEANKRNRVRTDGVRYREEDSTLGRQYIGVHIYKALFPLKKSCVIKTCILFQHSKSQEIFIFPPWGSTEIVYYEYSRHCTNVLCVPVYWVSTHPKEMGKGKRKFLGSCGQSLSSFWGIVMSMLPTLIFQVFNCYYHWVSLCVQYIKLTKVYLTPKLSLAGCY